MNEFTHRYYEPLTTSGDAVMTHRPSQRTFSDATIDALVAASNFDSSRTESANTWESLSKTLETYLFEMTYDALIEGHDIAASLREPLSYGALHSALKNWLPMNFTARFMAGTLICPVDDHPAHLLRFSEPDQMFFAFTSAVEQKASKDDLESNFVFKAPGVATIRTRLGMKGPLQYRFLIEVPAVYELADMKATCIWAGVHARSGFVYPMHLAECESVSEWIDLLMTRRVPGEYIDSFAQWHWRRPSTAEANAPRKGWARRRAPAAIKKAA